MNENDGQPYGQDDHHGQYELPGEIDTRQIEEGQKYTCRGREEDQVAPRKARRESAKDDTGSNRDRCGNGGEEKTAADGHQPDRNEHGDGRRVAGPPSRLRSGEPVNERPHQKRGDDRQQDHAGDEVEGRPGVESGRRGKAGQLARSDGTGPVRQEGSRDRQAPGGRAE